MVPVLLAFRGHFIALVAPKLPMLKANAHKNNAEAQAKTDKHKQERVEREQKFAKLEKTSVKPNSEYNTPHLNTTPPKSPLSVSTNVSKLVCKTRWRL